MRMPIPALLCLALFSATAPAQDAPKTDPDPEPAPPRRITLKGADCLDPSLARGWHYVDSNELLVDAGRRKYRILLSEFCTDLGHSPSVAFKGDSVSGRLCGHLGEKVVTRHMSCRIDRMELIDGDTWQQSANGRRGSIATSRKE